ncbi:hypothetical protein V7S43_016885 [Phytophthora oleae]|uniref:Uncharacterized protein n=1 Tax=Phytophthora oleae TaxID=2107226 RepID=A0ABD3EVP7_9STRA
MAKRKHDGADGDADDRQTQKRQRRLPPMDGGAANEGASSMPSASDLGGSIAFKEAWQLLKRDGWQHKPPPRRSLDLQYRYIRPGGDPNGTEGDDYLLGEAVTAGKTAVQASWRQKRIRSHLYALATRVQLQWQVVSVGMAVAQFQGNEEVVVVGDVQAVQVQPQIQLILSVVVM